MNKPCWRVHQPPLHGNRPAPHTDPTLPRSNRASIAHPNRATYDARTKVGALFAQSIHRPLRRCQMCTQPTPAAPNPYHDNEGQQTRQRQQDQSCSCTRAHSAASIVRVATCGGVACQMVSVLSHDVMEKSCGLSVGCSQGKFTSGDGSVVVTCSEEMMNLFPGRHINISARTGVGRLERRH